MVSSGQIIGLVLIAGLGFILLSGGGLNKIKAFGQSALRKNDEGDVSVPTLQSGKGDVQIKSGSITEVRKLLDSPTATGGVTARRKGTTGVTGITSREKASADTLRKLSTFSGSGVAQFSTGEVGALSAAQLKEIRERVLTPQEQQDVRNLEARRKRFIDSGGNPNLKLSGAELVLRKREQEALAQNFIRDRFGGKSIVGGKLFAKEGFASGGLTPALIAERARSAAPTVNREGKLVERTTSDAIRARTLSRTQQALEFNRQVIAAKKAGTAVPTFQGFLAGTKAGGF